MLEVVEPGALATIQDDGRPGLGHLGVPPSGAADPWGLAEANVLAGAPAGAPAIELTLGGAELHALATCVVGLGGADLGAERDDGVRLAAGAAHRLPAGSRIRFAGGTRGLRAYLGLAGGVAARAVLGSASTYGPGRLGRNHGRPLHAGDRLAPVRRGDLSAAGNAWPELLAPHPLGDAGPLGLVSGPDLAALPRGTVDAFLGTAWRADAASDRMGIRLVGPPVAAGDEILSHPLVPGAVQVPPGGLPIVALVDGPTLGGYPVLGVVPCADIPRLGQARPGDVLRFASESAAAARARAAEQRARLARAGSAIALDVVWLSLADDARG